MPITKLQCCNILLSQISIQKIFSFSSPNSIKQMFSKFRHSQKQLLKTKKCSESNAGKLASGDRFSSQKHTKKDFSTPTHLKF